MTVHPKIAEFLSTLPPSDDSLPDIAGWRASGEAQVPALEDRLPIAHVEDRVATSLDGETRIEIPVRIYRASGDESASADEPAGLLLYFHGGAFFSGSLDTHDGVARSLAQESGYTVVSVGYRLAPEHRYPAGLTDCYAALEWAASHGDELRWDGKNLAVAGDSSGGTFAAAITAMAYDRGGPEITAQVLLYPSIDLDFDVGRYASLRSNGVGYGLETVALKPHNSFYIASGADPADPLVSPIKRPDLTGLPPALVITAEYDPLRDEGEAYAERLRDSGVEVQLTRYDGATHGFAQHFGWLPEYAEVFREVGAFLKKG